MHNLEHWTLDQSDTMPQCMCMKDETSTHIPSTFFLYHLEKQSSLLGLSNRHMEKVNGKGRSLAPLLF